MSLPSNTTTSRRLASPQSSNPGRPNPSGFSGFISSATTSTAPATTSARRAVAEVAPTTVSSNPTSLVR